MRPFHPLAFLVAAFVLLAPLAALDAAEQGATGERLKEVERAIETGREKEKKLKRKAASLTKELARFRVEMVTAAKANHDLETQVLDLEEEIDRLLLERAAKIAGLKRNHGHFARVLMALEKLARHPPEALIVEPLSGPDLVRSAILLRAAVPAIESQAEHLRQELSALAFTRRQVDKELDRLAKAAASLQEKRARLDALVREKNKLRDRTLAASKSEKRRVLAMARKARNLRELLESLSQEPRQPAAAVTLVPPTATNKPPSRLPEGRPISRSRGRLPYPAIGRLIGRYGQATDTGLTRKGIVIETRAEARVIAPHNGKVVFAGNFRGYGQLLIIEHGEGYHSLLAGMARIDNAIGQLVSAGEPVGVMGRPKGKKPTLYVELRRNGQPINPLPWLAARKNRVSG